MKLTNLFTTNKEINGKEKTHRNIKKKEKKPRKLEIKKPSGLLFGDVRLHCLFSKRGLFQEWAQENTAGRGVDYRPGLRTARSKSFRKEAAHRKVPTKIPFLYPAPATTRAPNRKQLNRARGHASPRSPAQHG